MGDDYIKFKLESDKAKMIERHLKARGISNENLLNAFLSVPREKLIPKDLIKSAYLDQPLAIGYGATISQPYIVAKTLYEAQIKAKDRVLEIGTGSGYQTALLAELGAEVYTIEYIEELSLLAQEKLKELGYSSIQYWIGDGHLGWPKPIQFDAIVLSAAPIKIPEKLLKQLKIGGRLVGPEGSESKQNLVSITRDQAGFSHKILLNVRFVPMIVSSSLSLKNPQS